MDTLHERCQLSKLTQEAIENQNSPIFIKLTKFAIKIFPKENVRASWLH